MQGHFWHISVFDALSHGTLGSAFHGSFNNQLISTNLIGCWRISTNQKMVQIATMESKTEGTMWKSIKNCVRKRSQKWCCILFWANHRENKQRNSHKKMIQKMTFFMCTILFAFTLAFWTMCSLSFFLTQPGSLTSLKSSSEMFFPAISSGRTPQLTVSGRPPSFTATQEGHPQWQES